MIFLFFNQALRLKGVSEADAEKAIKLVFKDGQSGEDQSRFGLSKSSLDQLYAQASKRWLQSQSQPVEKRKSKIIQWLQYRGFNWGVVNGVLKKLESDFPPQQTQIFLICYHLPFAIKRWNDQAARLIVVTYSIMLLRSNSDVKFLSQCEIRRPSSRDRASSKQNEDLHRAHGLTALFINL